MTDSIWMPPDLFYARKKRRVAHAEIKAVARLQNDRSNHVVLVDQSERDFILQAVGIYVPLSDADGVLVDVRPYKIPIGDSRAKKRINARGPGPSFIFVFFFYSAIIS